MSLLILVFLGALVVHCHIIEVNHIYHESGDTWTEISHQPTVEGNRLYGVAQRTLSTGHDIFLDYDFRVKANTVFLDNIEGIFPYSCSKNSFVVKLQNFELQNLFVVGGFLIGKIGYWDCVDNGIQRNVLQKILSISYDSNTHLLSMNVRWISHFEVIGPNSRLSIIILPGNFETQTDFTSGVLELYHASEVPVIYVGKNDSRRYQKRDLPPPPFITNTNINNKNVGPISVTCTNNFQVSLGVEQNYTVSHQGSVQTAKVGISVNIQGNFILSANANAKGKGNLVILDKKKITSFTIKFGNFEFHFDPYVMINSEYSWSVAAKVSNVGFHFPSKTFSRGVEFNALKGTFQYQKDPQDGFQNFLSWEKNPQVEFTGAGDVLATFQPRFGLSIDPEDVDFFTELKISMNPYTVNLQCLKMGMKWKIEINTRIEELKIGEASFSDSLFNDPQGVASNTLPQSVCKQCLSCIKASTPSTKRMISQDDTSDDTSDDDNYVPYYVTSNWTDCSNDCDNLHELTYATVTCMINGQEVDPDNCGGIDPPPSVAYCDKSQCIPCTLFKSCDSCIVSPCYWCPKTQMCNDTCTNPDDKGGQYYFCIAAEEIPINISSCNTTGPLPWTVDWTGGYNNNGTVGGVYIYVIDEYNSWLQFGVPESISSTQTTIPWQPKGIVGGSYIFLLVSSTNVNNWDICFVNVTTQNGSTTVVSSWSSCSQSCGGGYQTRIVSCFNNGVLNNSGPCTGDAPVTYQSCNEQLCPAGSLLIESPKSGDVFTPNSNFTISWIGGNLGKLLSVDMWQSLPDSQLTIVTQNVHIAFVYNGNPFNSSVTLPSNLPSGDYVLSLSVVDLNLESTDVYDEVPIHISGMGQYMFDIIVKNLDTVNVTLYGNIDTLQFTLNPNSTSCSISVPDMKNIGYVYQAFTTSNNLVAMTVHTNQSTKSIFAMIPGSNSSDCSLQLSCDFCLNIITCGWCDSAQLCLPVSSGKSIITNCTKNWITNTTGIDCHSFCVNNGHIIAIRCVALLGMILLQLILM